MAATASAYRNSGERQSAKTEGFLSREAVQSLLDSADFSKDLGKRRYRNRHLRATLVGMWKAAAKPWGNEVLLFASVEGYSIEAGVCERQFRYNLRALEKIGVVELVYPANSRIRPDRFRHTATHRLNLSKLRRRTTYEDVKSSRKFATPIRSQSPAPAAAAAPPSQAVTPPASPAASGAVCRTTSPKPIRKLTPREGPELVKRMKDLMAGQVEYFSPADGFSVSISPGHPRYRAPMSQENALIAACMSLGIPTESAREHLKLCSWKFEEADDGQSP